MTIVAGNKILVRSRSSKYELHVDVMIKDHTGVPLSLRYCKKMHLDRLMFKSKKMSQSCTPVLFS